MCVGHGACAAACPTKAISLVFGTETRGVDIPMLSPEFETSVPGIFIAGELGGMGLIKNAIEQGRQAMDHAAARAGKMPGRPGYPRRPGRRLRPGGHFRQPGGDGKEAEIPHHRSGDAGRHGRAFPARQAGDDRARDAADRRQGQVRRDQQGTLAGVLGGSACRAPGSNRNSRNRSPASTRAGQHFEVVTSKGSYRTKTVVLAIGRRGTPRPLEVPGEDLEKVVYRLIDPEQYAGRKVLVVGGGDSALEAAARVAEQPDTRVTLAYRGNAYSRARAKNRDRVAELAATGRLQELLGSSVRQHLGGDCRARLPGRIADDRQRRCHRLRRRTPSNAIPARHGDKCRNQVRYGLIEITVAAMHCGDKHNNRAIVGRAGSEVHAITADRR